MNKRFIAVLMANVFVFGGFGFNNLQARGCSGSSGQERCSYCGSMRNSKKCNARSGSSFMKTIGPKRCNSSVRRDAYRGQPDNGGDFGGPEQYSEGGYQQKGHFNDLDSGNNSCEDFGSQDCTYSGQHNNTRDGYMHVKPVDCRISQSDRGPATDAGAANMYEANAAHYSDNSSQNYKDAPLNSEPYGNNMPSCDSGMSNDFGGGHAANDANMYVNNSSNEPNYDGNFSAQNPQENMGNFSGNNQQNMNDARQYYNDNSAQNNTQYNGAPQGFANNNMAPDNGFGDDGMQNSVNHNGVNTELGGQKFDECQGGYCYQNNMQNQQNQQYVQEPSHNRQNQDYGYDVSQGQQNQQGPAQQGDMYQNRAVAQQQYDMMQPETRQDVRQDVRQDIRHQDVIENSNQGYQEYRDNRGNGYAKDQGFGEANFVN